MKVFYYAKHATLFAFLIGMFGLSSIAHSQALTSPEAIEHHLQKQLQGYYDADQPGFHHQDNTRAIQQYAASLINANVSTEGVDDYSKTFFIKFTGNQINSFQEQLYVLMGSLVAPTIVGFGTYAIADNLINPKLYKLGKWLTLEKEEQILLHDPLMFDRYMTSKKKLFRNLDEVLHHLISNSFFVQHEGSSYILGLNSTKEKIILSRQRFVKLLSLLMMTPQDEVSVVATNFVSQARSGYLTKADFIPNTAKRVAVGTHPSTTAAKSVLDAPPLPKKIYNYLPKVIAFTAAVGTLVWMESTVFTNEFDPDANPGLFEIGSLDVFLHQFSQAVENRDPAQLQSVMNQYPVLTAIVAKEIKTIGPAIARYHQLTQNL